MQKFDLAVVGAGILGLAHALAAVRLGKRVVVVDRDPRANGASIRNFGFVTVAGQERGATWRRAMRARDVWDEVAPQAGIRIDQQGCLLIGRRPEARGLVEAFLRTEMGEDCRALDPADVARAYPMLKPEACSIGLYSPHERRVESRDAIPRLAAWLAKRHDVTYLRGVAVTAVEAPYLQTSKGPIEAEAIVVCPGDDLATLFPERIAARKVTRCKLQMLRIAPPEPGWTLPCPVLTDLSLARYLGFAALPEAVALKARLEDEQAEHLAHGIHLIVVQSADGSLVIGDSHHYAPAPDPFGSEAVDNLILEEYAHTVAPARPEVLERWIGTYASAPSPMFIDRPAERVRLVMVTSGTGASTGFAVAEETIAELYG